MAYEMRDNSFQFDISKENIGQKFPTIKAAIKLNGVQHDLAVWAKPGKFGMQFFGDASKLGPFMRALFGTASKAADAKAAAQPEPKKETPKPIDRPEDRTTLLR